MRVLVVSEEQTTRDNAHVIFPPGTEVVTARDAREAWALLHEGLPDVVVVTLQSGSAGGFALARDMSQVEDFADIPVVMLLDRDQDAWLARTAGAAKVLRRPVPPDVLAEEVLALAGDR